MVHSLFFVEKKFGTSEAETRRLMNEFGSYLDSKYCVMSTPVMNNAGRYQERPLSACTVPPVDLRKDLAAARTIVDRFHMEGMGTGFNLDTTDDPAGVLGVLNDSAVAGARSGREDRPVGNMAVLSVHHPKILDFISAKTGADGRGEDWKFNISVDASDEFMAAAAAGQDYALWDGKRLPAREVLGQIVSSAHECGDPGLVFIGRMNRDNPTPGVGAYVSTAPCGEVGLAPGETCQFGYINLAAMARKSGGQFVVDFGHLEKLTRLLTRVLDNALEISISRYSHITNQEVMRAKRKIGIGICGLADLLILMKIPYDSPVARQLATDLTAFINYISKLESHELAKRRGSFTAMFFATGCRYNDNPGFLENKYGTLDTQTVSGRDWTRLGKLVRETKLLRNASTIALPPTGRSGLVIDASTGVEPLFSLVQYGGGINTRLQQELLERRLLTPKMFERIARAGQIGDFAELPDEVRAVFRTALEITPDDHLLMVREVQRAVDEAISKTINLPADSTPSDIWKTYVKAYEYGLKGVTIFRTGSRTVQPRELAKV